VVSVSGGFLAENFAVKKFIISNFKIILGIGPPYHWTKMFKTTVIGAELSGDTLQHWGGPKSNSVY
jgi:hypothetical protein